MRKIIGLNDQWEFEGGKKQREMVSVPHTWNALDGQDGGNNYYRGICSYTKRFPCPHREADEKVYIECNGVNSSARVELNGNLICEHEGGYSTFRGELTPYLQEDNKLVITVDNSVNDSVYPQKADFTFYGGIYRDVNLVVVPKNHFDLMHYGDGGLHVKATPDNGEGRIQTTAYCKGQGTVQIQIFDGEGRQVAAGTGASCNLLVKEPHLWQGIEDPYLYTAVATLFVDGVEQDRVSTRFGFRSFHVDADRGFFLNGRSYPLHGVSRHQDRKALGNAISREQHREDMELIKEIGANTIRLAHYQHDAYFYDLCDEYGMVVWAEIPYISEHLPNGNANTESQMIELIQQNYNHPSIVCWGVSNEITISTKDKKDMLENHERLNDLCHKLDSTRFTTLACYAMCGPMNPVAHITDTVAWNLYLGWYVPGKFLNDWFMKFFHWKYPKQPLGYSEYGAEGMPNLHSARPRRGDHTEEYQCVYHEYMLECFKRHPFLWATHVWNMFDFAADARDQGGEPGMNHKGLVTFDRKVKKDAFYLYKAYWSQEKFVHICSKRFENRVGDRMELKVYSNCSEVSLYVNDKLLETKKGDKIYTFSLPLEETTRVEVRSAKLKDYASFHKVAQADPSYTLKKNKTSANWV